MKEINKTHTIKQIIFWLNEIKELEEVRDFIMKSNFSSVKPKLQSKRKLIFNYYGIWEINLSEDMTIMIMRNFGEQIDKLKQMIAEKDEDLIEIATGIFNGDITQEKF